jgi:flagellin
MSLVLNTNISSLVAQNSLSSNGTSLATSLQQLSSGLRINTAADDAAGYAIVQGMTSQINGINQAANNANDGVSLAQTASGAMTEITNDLQTMRNLAVQSLNATNSPTDRADLDAQFQQLKADINSVASQTQFNGVNLLDGSFQGATFQVGANAGQSITMSSIASTAANNLGQMYTAAATDPTAYTSTGAAGGTAVVANDTGSFTLTANGNTYTTSSVTLTGNAATDLKTIVSAINQATGAAGIVATVDSSGKGINLSTTTANTTVGVTYNAGTGAETLATFGLKASNAIGASGFLSAAGTYSATGIAAGDTGKITIAGTQTASFNITGTASTDLANAAAAINAINGTTGITATVNTAGTGIVLSSATSQSPTLSLAVTNAGAAGTETITNLGLTATEAITTANTAAPTPAGTVNTANVQTVDSSNQVLIQVDAALQQLATTGAQLGAYQNRFQAAVTGLNTDSTNLTSARSQIQDTNYAAATSALSKAQILQQAGTAMVAQANTIPQNILTLLQKLP